MISDGLPDIPRAWTALAEWLACVATLLALRHSLRLRPWHAVVVIVVALPALILVQYAAGAMPIQLWVLGMLCALVAMASVLAFLFRISLIDLSYHTARAFVLAEFLASLHWQLSTYLVDAQPLATAPGTLALGVAVFGAGLAVALILDARNPSDPSDSGITAADAWVAVAIALVTFAMSNLSFITVHTPFSGRLGPEVFYIRTLVDLCGCVALYAQQERIRETRAASELDSIEATLHSQHEQYLQSKANIEAAGRTYHDLRHHMEVLRHQLDPERALSHFADLEQSIAQIGSQFHCGNPVLDVVLTSKSAICSRENIAFTAVVDGALLSGLSAMDIATLFGNALDNAIEASRKVTDPEQRMIRVNVHARGSMVIVRVENWYTAALRTDSTGNFLTTKTRPEGHGLGLKSIRYTAEKYGAEVSTTTDGQWFTLTILFPHLSDLTLSGHSLQGPDGKSL